MKKPTEFICPGCANIMTVQKPMLDNDDEPKEGDVSICFNCGQLNIFTKDMKLAQLSIEDKASIPPELLVELEKISNKLKNDYKANLN